MTATHPDSHRPPASSRASDLSQIGWASGTRPAPRVDLDAAGGWQWNVARVWTTAGYFEAPAVEDGTMWAIVGVDGVGSIQDAEAEFRLLPRDLLVLPSDRPIRSTAHAPWARIIWRFETRLLRQPSFDGTLSRVHHLSDGHYNLLMAITGAIAPSASSVWEVSAPYINYVLASGIATALADAIGPVHHQLTKDRTGHYRDAIRLIDARFLDPSLKVADVARDLAMSVSYLHRLFAEVDTTPAREIERRRVQRAFAILSSVQQPTAAALDAVAVQSGFTSARRMRHAMRRGDWHS